MPDDPQPLSIIGADALAQIVMLHGGPANPDDLDRDIFEETRAATQIDPTPTPPEEWRWTTCD